MRRQLRSRGLATDLGIAARDGEVIRREQWVVSRTPASPRFWWGNFLLFFRPPAAGDITGWERAFDAEVGRLPGVSHRHFAWDAPDGESGEVGAFIEKGYALTRGVYLFAARVPRPTRFNPDLEVRPLARLFSGTLRVCDGNYRPGRRERTAFGDVRFPDGLLVFRNLSSPGAFTRGA